MAEYARGSRSKRKYASDYCDQQERENFTKFKALIATPGNLVSGVSLPANTLIFISTSSVLAVTTVLMDAVGPDGTRGLGAPAGPANLIQAVGYLYRATTLKKHSGAPGTVNVYTQNGLGKMFLIAQG